MRALNSREEPGSVCLVLLFPVLRQSLPFRHGTYTSKMLKVPYIATRQNAPIVQGLWEIAEHRYQTILSCSLIDSIRMSSF